MTALLNQLANTFQTLLSRGFWFGNFLPVAVFAGAHLILAWLAFPNTVPLAGWLQSSAAAELAIYAPLIVLGLIIIAYLLAPMIPRFRGYIEGSLLPEPVNMWLWRYRFAETRRIRNDFSTALSTHGRYQELWNTASAELFTASAAGQARVSPIGASAQIEAAETAVNTLGRASLWSRRLPVPADAERALQLVAEAVRNNNDALPPTHADASERRWSARAARAKTLLLQVLDETQAAARHRYLFLLERNREIAFNPEQPQATRVADARFLMQRYSRDAYNADFDYLSPRLQAVLPDKDPVADRLASARTQLDFSVLSLVGMISLIAVWLPLLGWSGRLRWLLLGLGFSAPFLVRFFYQLVFASQMALSEVVKVVIDRFRFDVLTILHQPLPPTLAAERQIWSRLGNAESGGDLGYRPPS